MTNVFIPDGFCTLEAGSAALGGARRPGAKAREVARRAWPRLQQQLYAGQRPGWLLSRRQLVLIEPASLWSTLDPDCPPQDEVELPTPDGALRGVALVSADHPGAPKDLPVTADEVVAFMRRDRMRSFKIDVEMGWDSAPLPRAGADCNSACPTPPVENPTREGAPLLLGSEPAAVLRGGALDEAGAALIGDAAARTVAGHAEPNLDRVSAGTHLRTDTALVVTGQESRATKERSSTGDHAGTEALAEVLRQMERKVAALRKEGKLKTTQSGLATQLADTMDPPPPYAASTMRAILSGKYGQAIRLQEEGRIKPFLPVPELAKS